MPELPICIYCRKPVHQDDEDYVVPNKEEEPYRESAWKYAHAKCYKEHGLK